MNVSVKVARAPHPAAAATARQHLRSVAAVAPAAGRLVYERSSPAATLRSPRAERAACRKILHPFLWTTARAKP